jgi:predicted RNA-binding protein with PIN domain
MDPVQKMWMFENWLGDQLDKSELAKNHAYLLASFDHPDAVKQIMGEGNVHMSSDEEFEESSRMVQEINEKSEKMTKDKPIKRKRRKIKDN